MRRRFQPRFWAFAMGRGVLSQGELKQLRVKFDEVENGSQCHHHYNEVAEELLALVGQGTRDLSGYQDLNSWAGKILRITPDGQIPKDNPFPSSPVFSYGHRVVQGLAWDLDTGVMFNFEHGPSGEWPGVDQRDEINLVEKGGNYGWAKVVGAPRLAEYRDPIVMCRGASVPPAGITFYRGDLFVATLRSETLIRIQFEDHKDYKVARIERWFAHDWKHGIYGRLRDVTMGPDGHLYVLTSNTDGRAELRPSDDKILRLRFQTTE